MAWWSDEQEECWSRVRQAVVWVDGLLVVALAAAMWRAGVDDLVHPLVAQRVQ